MLVSFKPAGRTFPSQDIKAATKPTLQFSGINASLKQGENQDLYRKHIDEHPEEHLLSPFATSLFREAITADAVGKLLASDKKSTGIHVLGCSDGSEVDSYGIMAHHYLSKKALKDVQITGVDREQDLVELARTGYRVHSQQEKERQDSQGTPVAGSKWRLYFVPEGPPPNFDELVKQFPRLQQITRDPVIEDGVIGKKLEWNRIKRGNLPETQYVHSTLENYVANQPASSHQRQIYVLANSWGYMMVKDAKNPAHMQVAFDDAGKKMNFLKVISDIKKNNANKEVILVVGEIERQILEHFPNKNFLFNLLGLKPFSAEEMQKIGMTDPNGQRILQGRMWRLST